VLAEYVLFDQSGLVHIPTTLSYQEAACLPCAGVTAWNALYGLNALAPGETVLALGTGGVAIFAVQFAHLAGARVVVTSSSDAKLARAKEFGAAAGINYNSVPEWQVEALKLTGGIGVTTSSKPVAPVPGSARWNRPARVARSI
jgi:NADPH:quinone reductase-like Zn-dependent oxidoreductase